MVLYGDTNDVTYMSLYNNLIDESNENNNTLIKIFTVKPLENADLVINSAEVTKKDYSGTVKIY